MGEEILIDGYDHYHINKANFKNKGERYWFVGYNNGGIGTPLIDVNKDVEFFKDQAKIEERKRIKNKSINSFMDNTGKNCLVIYEEEFEVKDG